MLEAQMGRLRGRIHPVRLHALRYTFLTETGAHDPLTLQYGAGHDSMKKIMRYAHPRENQ